MKNNGVLRLLAVFLVCFSVLFYNVKNAVDINNQNIKNEEKKENLIYFWEEESSSSETAQAVTSETQEQEESVSSSKTQTSSVEASAGAVKGKIISKYISPYNAALSYNGVYIKNSTDLDINIKSLLESKLGFKLKETSEPQVLIVHTHATETFMETDSDYYTEQFNSRTNDNNKNMVRIGAIVAEKLNNAGIVTLHDTTQHDNPQYTGSYSRSAKTVNSYLAKYPSIKIVLDLHRDAVSSGESDKVKLVTEINGKKAAQVMLVMGSQSGTVKNYPNWQENLKLALKLQKTMESKFPTLARPLLLMPKSYNQGLSNGSLLIEFGTDANSLDEAIYSAELVGESLITLIQTLKE